MRSADTAGISVRRFVGRVRARSRGLDLGAGVATFVAGGVAFALAWNTRVDGWLFCVAVTVGLAGAFVALAGARAAGRAIRRPADRHTVAGWIERALPGLRDSLAATLEGGPLAKVSARYAAARLPVAPPRGVEPPSRARRRVGLLAAAAAVLAAGLVAGRARPDTPTVLHPRDDVSGAAKAEATKTAAAAGGQDEAEAAITVIVRGPAGGGAASQRPRSADVAEVLISSPRGYERAVDIFMGGEARGRPNR